MPWLAFVGGTFASMGGVPLATPGLAVWHGGGWWMPSAWPAQQPFFAIAGVQHRLWSDAA